MMSKHNTRGFLLAAALLAFVLFLSACTSQPVLGEGERTTLEKAGSETDPRPTRAASGLPAALSPIATPADSLTSGIPRLTSLLTRIPKRSRMDVITYTVKTGDNLFDIADSYGLDPETILWSNYETLEDNPHLLSPDQVLFILPLDGSYYHWKEGDTLRGVADFHEVAVEDILNYSGNDLDLTAVDDQYGLEEGAWLVIPNGKRPFKDWGPPAISRSDPASASYYGPGHCGAVYQGAMGTGTFVWPSTERFLSGYHYSGIHRAIDIGGAMGNSIFAADSGVVVYAGWSNYGYGNLIVIDHGNGWQTAYAHLDTLAVTCGQSVYQGGYIGGMGSTGNSSGPHLHFELVYNGSKPNPMDYLR